MAAIVFQQFLLHPLAFLHGLEVNVLVAVGICLVRVIFEADDVSDVPSKLALLPLELVFLCLNGALDQRIFEGALSCRSDLGQLLVQVGSSWIASLSIRVFLRVG